MRMTYLHYLSIGILFLLASSLRCKELGSESVWKQTEIKVDGVDSEWSGSLIYLEENNIGIGLQNDADNLYIILKTANQNTQHKVMRTGLTVWLDAKGKKKKTLGIHYPIGMQPYGMPSGMSRQPSENPNELQSRFTERMKEMEILNSEKNSRSRVPKINYLGIEFSLNNIREVMIYELKIPLKSTKEFPYAINANPGELISLGLETGKFKLERTEGNRPMGEGMPGGRNGMPPGGKPPGDMPPGDRRGGMMSEPIKFWFKVSLARTVDDKN